MGLTFDASELLVRLFKYVLEGLVVAVAAHFLPGNKISVQDTFLLGLIAAATFAVLDLFAPSIGASVRSGAGYGIGFNMVGFPGGAPPVKW